MDNSSEQPVTLKVGTEDVLREATEPTRENELAVSSAPEGETQGAATDLTATGTTPAPRQQRRRRRKGKSTYFVVGLVLVMMGAVFAGVSMLRPQAPSTPIDPTTTAAPPPSDYSSTPPFDPGAFIAGILNIFAPNMSIHNTSTLNSDQQKAIVDALQGIGLLSLAIGGGAFVYAKRTKRKFLEFDKLGVLITDARKRESMSAKFIPWGCLEQIEVLNFDVESQEAMAQAATEASKAMLLFHVDDGNTIKIRWADVVRCVEPGQFINALKTYAPEACPQFETLAGDAHKVDKNTYTQLWFRYYSTGSERKRTTHLVAGDTLLDGRFEIVGQIGGGGQGTAYVAVDKNDESNTEVVLKEYILPVHRGQQVLQQTVQKLEQEAAILRKIDHSNIVKLLDSFVEDHRGYLVMEYVQGKQLKDIVSTEGPQPEDLVIDIARQVCDVLSYLHSQDPAIIHRDLTPDNLILQSNGLVKLVDFNVAHQLESAATATVVGKHCYIPPEQFRGKPTVQSDIYALGCTLHYLLTATEPEPLTASKPKLLNESVSEEFSAMITKSTALDHNKRYPTVAELHADLATLKTATKIRV